MPIYLKLVLSAMVALAALGGWLYMGFLGQTGPQNALVFLGPFSVFSLWIFPEVMRKKPSGKDQGQ